MDKETLTKIFSDYKPNCKESTCKQYATTLSKVAKDFNKDNDYLLDDFLDKPQEIFDYLKNKGLAKSSQANILNTIIIYMDAKSKNNSIYKQHKELLDEAINDVYNNGKPTQLQIDNWASFEEVATMLFKLDRLCDNPAKTTNTDWLKTLPYDEKWTHLEMEQVRLMLHIIMKYPSRNEYSSLRFVSWRNFKKQIFNGEPPKGNWILIRSQHQPELIISDYKTSDKYGIKRTKITDKFLISLLMNKYKQIGENYLFTYPKIGGHWKRHYVSQMLGKWTQKLMGKRISTTILYKIIIHDLGLSYDKALQQEDWDIAKKSAEKLKHFAKIRGHSFKVQKKVYHVPLADLDLQA